MSGSEDDLPGKRSSAEAAIFGNDEESSQTNNESTRGPHTLYISGISKSMTEEAFRSLFEPFGTLTRCQIIVDPHTREARGFGFVSFEEEEAIEAAINSLNRTEQFGRVLGVEKAKRDRPRSPTPGKYIGAKRDHRPERSDRRRYGRSSPPRRYDTYRGGRDNYQRHNDRSRSPSPSSSSRRYHQRQRSRSRTPERRDYRNRSERRSPDRYSRNDSDRNYQKNYSSYADNSHNQPLPSFYHSTNPSTTTYPPPFNYPTRSDSYPAMPPPFLPSGQPSIYPNTSRYPPPPPSQYNPPPPPFYQR